MFRVLGVYNFDCGLIDAKISASEKDLPVAVELSHFGRACVLIGKPFPLLGESKPLARTPLKLSGRRMFEIACAHTHAQGNAKP